MTVQTSEFASQTMPNLSDPQITKSADFYFSDLCLFSGELELDNILTIGDIHEYKLSWDFEEREEGLQYPVFYYLLKSELSEV